MNDLEKRLIEKSRQLYALVRELHRYEEAVAIGEEALALALQVHGPRHHSQLAIRNNLGTAYRNIQRLPEAEAHFRYSVELGRALFDADAPELLALLNNLADICRLMEKYDEANVLYDEVASIISRTLGQDHPNYSYVLMGKAMICEARQDVPGAVSLMEQASQLQAKALGENHPQYLECLTLLADIHLRHDAAAEAEPILERLVRLTPEVLGERHPMTARNVRSLERAREKLGKSAAPAEPIIKTPSPGDWNRCLANYRVRDYEGCIASAQPFLMAGMEPYMMLLTVICLRRLGRSLPEFFKQLPFMGVLCENEWQSALAQVALAGKPVESLQELAQTAEQRCQWHFYAAAFADDRAEVLSHLHACLEEAADCRERLLAQYDLQELEAASSPVEKPPLNPRQQLIDQCLKAYRERDYGQCLQVSMQLAQQGGTIAFWLLPLICLQRVGQKLDAVMLGSQCLSATKGHPWEHGLVSFVMGQTTEADILSQATSPERISQAHFFIAAMALTAGDKEKALNHLQRCVQTQVPCAEVALAYVDLMELQPADPEAKGDDLPDELGDMFVEFRRVYHQGRYPQAKKIATEAYRYACEKLPKIHSERARAANLLAEVCRAMGEFEVAEPLYLEACDIYAQSGTEGDVDHGVILNNLAELYRTLGKLQAAEALYEQSGDIFRKTVGSRHRLLATNYNNRGELYRALGDEKRAQEMYQQALQCLPPTKGVECVPQVRFILNLGRSYIATEDLDSAEKCQQQAEELFRTEIGEDHPDYAISLGNAANIQMARKQLVQAEATLKKCLKIIRERLGPQHFHYASVLNNLGVLLVEQHNLKEAEQVLREVWELNRDALGEDHPETVTMAFNLVHVLSSSGLRDEAQALYEKSISQLRRALGPEHPKFLSAVTATAEQLRDHGNVAAARIGFDEVDGVMRAMAPEKLPKFIEVIVSLGTGYMRTGNMSRAEHYLRQGMTLLEAAGQKSNLYINCVNSLSVICFERGLHDEARELAARSLDLTRNNCGEISLQYAAVLNNDANRMSSLGDLEGALAQCQRALEIQRQCNAENDPEYARVMANTARILVSLGELGRAEKLYLQALEIRERALGDQHPDCARTLQQLGQVYKEMGYYQRAVDNLTMARQIQLKTVGTQHRDYVNTINTLALVFGQGHDLEQAENLINEALEINRNITGDNTEESATLLANLASVKASRGDFAGAEAINLQLLERNRKAHGPGHITSAVCLNNLGMVYESMGRTADSLPYLEEALAIRRSALSEQHPEFNVSAWNLAIAYLRLAKFDQAVPLLQLALANDARRIGHAFASGTNEDRLRFLESVRPATEVFLSLVLSRYADQKELVTQAFELVLRRKGLALEALVAQRDLLLAGKYPELLPQLHELSHLRKLVARKAAVGIDADSQAARTRVQSQRADRIRELETELARRIPEMNIEQYLREVDGNAVGRCLPAGTALIEFYRFDNFDLETTKWESARYLAFVLASSRAEDVQLIDLGEAESIELMVRQFRDHVTGEGAAAGQHSPAATSNPVTSASGPVDGSALRAAIFDKLRPALGDCRNLLLAPDGDLSRLPFEALPTTEGRRLIDDYHISYLSTGRDMLRLKHAAYGTATAPLVIADPDFDLGLDAALPLDPPDTPQGRHSRDLNRGRSFQRLPGTDVEGRSVAIGLGVEPLLAAAALKARLKSCRSPRMLHLATHGFFLTDQQRSPNPDLRDLGELSGGFADEVDRLIGTDLENPLLRSGLVLAGVNTWLKGKKAAADAEDGILTAEDVTALDLLDTDLVVLSACETGLGEIQVGEGVFGLRRAFVLAGARTLVMSLWKVPDQQTQELMGEFYSRILAGAGRAEALRDAQLSLKARHPDPFYWAAFICQGDPAPLP